MKRTLATLALLGAGASIVGVPTSAFAAQSGATTTQAQTAAQGTTQAGGHRRGPSEADRKAKATEILTSLVSKGTITQAQADKIIAALEAARPQRPANATSTDKANRRAGQASTAAGTATAAAPGTAAKAGRPAPGEHLKAALATLVSNGTITQAQLDAVVAAFEAARPARPAPTGAAPAAGSQASMRSTSATRA